MHAVTDRQQAILDFIVEATRSRGFPPTLREIGSAFGIRSTKGVNDHLEALQRKGKIRRQRGASRAIEVVEMPVSEGATSLSVPLVGRIAAGAPLLATENIEQMFTLDRAVARSPDVFLLRVQGDSMVGAHICDADYILVRPQETADDGEIVVALLEEEATVKRFFKEGGRVRLVPENEGMQPIVVDPETTAFQIVGKVVGVLRVF